MDALNGDFSNIITLTQWVITTSAIAIAAVSLKLSQASFEQSKKNNQFNNHISNKKFFSDHIIRELESLSYVSRSTVDINKYYHFMFPKSADGIFDLNENYENSLLAIRKYLIQTSNQAKKPGAFNYKKHQAKIASSLKDFGFDLVRLSRRDFNLVEEEIFKLVDSVTMLMTSYQKSHMLTEIDIHYR
ncbi:hypothetical protein IT774_00080 [Salinimonas marina]|uniref:DUF4760 domain-containing protein n=1 Tax=Salinimonas marina TaxID=2785918 RepID=A0A7S9HD43_9ALTE|nr:hypothetical protein IT774_00080 [Salinimonas marina]